MSDAEFRATVLVHLRYIRTGQDELKEKLEDHIKDDEHKFGQVNQKIGDNSSSIAKGMGIFAALVVMVGVIMWVIDKVQP